MQKGQIRKILLKKMLKKIGQIFHKIYRNNSFPFGLDFLGKNGKVFEF